MLILSVIQALSGRFYPWPCLMCWMLGRLLEVRVFGEWCNGRTQCSTLAEGSCFAL